MVGMDGATQPLPAPGAATSPAASGTSGPGGSGEARLGRFRLFGELGRGGMGVVHLGVDERGRAVAVKELHPMLLADPRARDRLAREVAHLSRVAHPGVAAIVEADVSGPRPYVVTRYVPGPSLRRLVDDEGPLAPPQLAALARDLADALTAVHAAGITHRDLKPDNVLLDQGRPVLIDFGIARGGDESALTHTGLVMGTPGFVAPELIDGDALGPATDWWAWAATLAFAASGRLPFGGGPAEAVLARLRAGEADLSGVDPRLRPLLQAALDPRPGARPPASVLMAGLDRYARGEDALPPPSGPAALGVGVAGGTAGSGMPGDESADSDAATRAFPAPAMATQSFPAAATRTRPLPAAPETAPVSSPASVPAVRPAVGSGQLAGTASVVSPARGAAAPAAAPRPGVLASPQLRRRVTIAALAVGLTSIAVIAPPPAALLGTSWALAARAADRSRTGLLRRRDDYGVRSGDVAGAWLRSPGHLLAAALPTLLSALVALTVGAGGVLTGLLLQSARLLPGAVADPGAAGPWLLGALGALATGWWGPGSASVRRGTRVLTSSAKREGSALPVLAPALAVLCVIGAYVVQHGGMEPWWWPLGGDPFRWVRDTL